MIKARTREELYDLFRQGAIPSGADYADFIKSQLNLLDDGLTIPANTDAPIGFRAHGKTANYLDLADSDGVTRWRISGYNEAATTEGLNFTTGGQSKLFLEEENGNVGIGTDGPQAKLHIIQTSATDALRIDDAGNDTTPLVVTSEGQVGVGTASPSAKLHLSYSGSGDILRVDDTDGDTTPLVVTETGNVGVGYSDPQAKLTVAGGMAVGANRNPGANNFFVAGNIEVAGSVVFSGGDGVGGIEINAPLTSKSDLITLKDNVQIIGAGGTGGSDGNLSVAGDTVLGTFQEDPARWNVLVVNGSIEAGYDPRSGTQQNELQVNEVLTVNRQTKKVAVAGSLTLDGIEAANVNMAPPVGTIIAWLPGLYQNANQTGFQAANLALPPNWRLCDGSMIAAADRSPLGAGYLPDLTNRRFLMGGNGTDLGQQAGNNDGWGHSHSFTNPTVPGHFHGLGTLKTNPSGEHRHDWNHGWERDDHGHGGSYNEFTWAPGGFPGEVVMSAAGSHNHTFTGAVGYLGGVNGDAAFQTVNGGVNGVRESLTEVNLPRYLAVKYIMRVK